MLCDPRCIQAKKEKTAVTCTLPAWNKLKKLQIFSHVGSIIIGCSDFIHNYMSNPGMESQWIILFQSSSANHSIHNDKHSHYTLSLSPSVCLSSHPSVLSLTCMHTLTPHTHICMSVKWVNWHIHIANIFFKLSNYYRKEQKLCLIFAAAHISAVSQHDDDGDSLAQAVRHWVCSPPPSQHLE